MRVILYKKINAQALSKEAAGDTLPGSLSLDRPHGKPGDEPIEEQVIDKCNWQAGDQAGSHERPPEVNVAAHQKDRDTYAHHLLRLWGNKRKGINVFLSHQREGED